MSNIHRAFEKGKALIPFVICGDPDLGTTAAAVASAAAGGADMILLGLPFSDAPEGPLMEEANSRALRNGARTDQVFAMVEQLRKDLALPMVFRAYSNVVFSYGSDRFISACKDLSIDGLMVPDLPFEERGEFLPLCERYGVDLISFLATTSGTRTAMIAQEAQGLLCVLSDGDQTEPLTESLALTIQEARKHSAVPLVVDGPLATPDQAKQLASVADGVVVSSAVVELCEQYDTSAPSYLGDWVRALKEAIR